jgi:hypothetical protein
VIVWGVLAFSLVLGGGGSMAACNEIAGAHVANAGSEVGYMRGPAGEEVEVTCKVKDEE